MEGGGCQQNLWPPAGWTGTHPRLTCRSARAETHMHLISSRMLLSLQSFDHISGPVKSMCAFHPHHIYIRVFVCLSVASHRPHIQLWTVRFFFLLFSLWMDSNMHSSADKERRAQFCRASGKDVRIGSRGDWLRLCEEENRWRKEAENP